MTVGQCIWGNVSEVSTLYVAQMATNAEKGRNGNIRREDNGWALRLVLLRGASAIFRWRSLSALEWRSKDTIL